MENSKLKQNEYLKYFGLLDTVPQCGNDYKYLYRYFSIHIYLSLYIYFLIATAKGVDVKSRMSELFHLVPEIRHVGIWHQQLMNQMKINVQKEEVQQLYDAVNYRES